MAKGGSFENEIAAKLSLWFTEGERDDVFGRSDGSGSRFTARKKKGKDTANQAGDITFTDLIGEPLIRAWNIEVKTGYADKRKVKDADGDVIKIPVYSTKKGETNKIVKWIDKVFLAPWDVLDFIDSKQKKPVLHKFWEQCVLDAEGSNREPILIFRRNLKSPCICIQRSFYLDFHRYFGGLEPCISLRIAGKKVMIVSLNAFFEWGHWPKEFARKFLKS